MCDVAMMDQNGAKSWPRWRKKVPRRAKIGPIWGAVRAKMRPIVGQDGLRWPKMGPRQSPGRPFYLHFYLVFLRSLLAGWKVPRCAEDEAR